MTERIAASLRGVGRTYGDVEALADVSFDIAENTIHGLLGRNGAGKTTLMKILTGLDWQTAGEVTVFGEAPFENPRVLGDVTFIRESQRYPDDVRVGQALSAAAAVMPRWDREFAADLLADFGLPARRRVKKLSRGMLSALGVVIGLASRAPLTFFDEPYLGLDAVSRRMFYDRLLADVAERPRTVVLSTHLIDEVADIVENVVVLDRGRVVLDAPAEDLRGSAAEVSGPADAVISFISGREVLAFSRLDTLARASLPRLDAAARAEASARGLTTASLGLQDLVLAAAAPRRETHS